MIKLHSGRSGRRGLLLATSALVVLVSSPARAQEAPAAVAGPAEEAPSQEIVVTASRIQANGFSAPTPTMVLSQAQIQAVAPLQVADVLIDALRKARRTFDERSARERELGIKGIAEMAKAQRQFVIRETISGVIMSMLGNLPDIMDELIGLEAISRKNGPMQIADWLVPPEPAV